MARWWFTLLTIGGLAMPVAAQDQVLDKVDAANLLDSLRVTADLARGASVEPNSPDAAVQGEVEKIADLAYELASDLRAGASREATRPRYRQIRLARLRVIELSMRHGAKLPENASEVEEIIRELDGYFAQP